MTSVPKGINKFKLKSNVRSNVMRWEKGKKKYVQIKPVWSSTSRRYVSTYKITGRGVGVPKQRSFKTNERAISEAIKLMRKK